MHSKSYANIFAYITSIKRVFFDKYLAREFGKSGINRKDSNVYQDFGL